MKKLQPEQGSPQHLSGSKPIQGSMGIASTQSHPYTDEEREFIVAMERWKKKTRRRFPSFSDCLAVLKSLGYRRVAEPTELPKYLHGEG